MQIARMCRSAVLCGLVTAVAVGHAGCKHSSAQDDRAGEAGVGPVLKIRPAAVAGSFYPLGRADLTAAVTKAYEGVEPVELPGRLIALIVPHAGYRFSAATAARAYVQLAEAPPATVVLVGPSHNMPVDGAAVSACDAWATPLGNMPVDRELAEELCDAEPAIRLSDTPHAPEHCLEVQLPLLRQVAPDCRIVPLAVTNESDEACGPIASALAEVLADTDAVLVASSDMAHYPAPVECRSVDQRTLEAIQKMDADLLRDLDREQLNAGIKDLGCTLCGLAAVQIVMRAAKGLGADRAVVLGYANSGEIAPELGDRAVGYGAVAFCDSTREPRQRIARAEPEEAEGDMEDNVTMLTAEQREYLLRLARSTLEASLSGRALPAAGAEDAALTRDAAVFVTLTKAGRLRGCIGCTEAYIPLAEAVQEFAVAAATRDLRFPAMRSEELDETSIEISVLSPLVKVDSADDIIVGTHGVMVEMDGRRGLFLPQVATDNDFGRDEFLSLLCAEKAGLPADAWKRGANLHVFTVEKFAETDEI